MALKTVRGRDPWSGAVLAVSIEDGLVRRIDKEPRPETGDLPWIAPGFTDLQVNGYRGHELNDPDLTTQTVNAVRRELRIAGVTTFVPTVITGSRDRTGAIVQALARARHEDEALRSAIPYIHLEGPYISVEEGPRGCHDPNHIRRPDFDEFEKWQELAEGVIGMITLSPHWEGAADFIAHVRSRGVRVSIGHTHATPQQIRAAVNAGAQYCTHLGNGAHATLPRHPNYIWAQLADERLSAGFIADGHHLDPDALLSMVRAKGLSHSFLVSDVSSAGGLPAGRYHTAVGGEVEVTGDGRLVVPGTPFLAGAAATIADGVARLASSSPLSLAQVLELATSNPQNVIAGEAAGSGLRTGRPDDMTFRWRPGDTSLRDVRVVEEAAA
jgi:N-acetylglucosamine-6-phosphate deacetylase